MDQQQLRGGLRCGALSEPYCVIYSSMRRTDAVAGRLVVVVVYGGGAGDGGARH